MVKRQYLLSQKNTMPFKKMQNHLNSFSTWQNIIQLGKNMIIYLDQILTDSMSRVFLKYSSPLFLSNVKFPPILKGTYMPLWFHFQSNPFLKSLNPLYFLWDTIHIYRLLNYSFLFDPFFTLNFFLISFSHFILLQLI